MKPFALLDEGRCNRQAWEWQKLSASTTTQWCGKGSETEQAKRTDGQNAY